MNAYLDMWERAFDFKGRTNPEDFWIAYTINVFIYIVLVGITFVVMKSDNEMIGGIAAAITMSGCIMCLIPFLSLQVRRFHDTGHSMGLLILCIVLYVFVIGLLIKVTILKKESKGDNKWGKTDIKTGLTNQNATDTPDAPTDSFVDRRITAAELPARKKWARNMLILFLISLFITIVSVVILISFF